MPQDTERLFIMTRPGHLFFKAAIPGALGMLLSSMYYLLEAILVGRVLGAEAFAGLNLAMPFVIINYAVADLIGVGSSVQIAIRLGKGDRESADNIFTCSVLMIIAAGVVLGSFLFISAPMLFRAMGADETLVPYAVSYLRVYALFSPLTTAAFAVDNYLRICGRIRYSLMMNVVLATMAVIYEMIFLILLGGGIASAALGTELGILTAVIFGFIPFLRGRLDLHFRRPRFSLPMIRTIIACGLPTFLSNVSGRLVSIVMNVMLLRFGGADAVSVYGILMNADGVVIPLLYGTCDALQPSVGYNWGAGRKDRVAAIEKYCFGFGAVLSNLLFLFLFFFPEVAVNLFIGEGGASIHSLGITAVRIASLGYIVRWIGICTQCFMSAIEKPRYAAAISVSNACLFPLLLIALLYPLHLQGIWMNQPLTALFCAALAVMILLRNRNVLRKS